MMQACRLVFWLVAVAADETLKARIASLASAAKVGVDSSLSTEYNPNEPPVDAVLFRTHFVDGMVLRKLNELVADSKPGLTSSVKAAEFELTVLYDADTVSDFSGRLLQHGFDAASSGVRLMGLHLKHFTRYPNVKPVPLAKSHNQHLAYTSWWAENLKRRNWRYVSTTPRNLFSFAVRDPYRYTR
jgi:hypothetical protein